MTTLSFGSTSDSGQRVGLAFSESSLYVGNNSDRSSGRDGEDGALYATASANGTYTVPTAQQRGGFRYLTVFLDTSGWVDLTGVSLNFTAAPGKTDPADYANYFSSSDDLLNRIWYAGAYTVQLNTIASHQGRAWPPPSSAWDNGATVGVGDSVLVDGAKRDRTVWPGDMGIAVPTQYAYSNDLVSTRNALTTMYNAQSAEGEIPGRDRRSTSPARTRTTPGRCWGRRRTTPTRPTGRGWTPHGPTTSAGWPSSPTR